MAVRRNLYHPEEVKLKIKTSQIVNRLTAYIFGEIELSKTQVNAALGLLKKTLPDLQSVDQTVKGDAAHPLVISKTDSQL
jgi:hypothetical protein